MRLRSDFLLRNAASDSDHRIVRKFCTTTITIIFSWIGWWLGDKIGLMTAFILSMIGMGIGIYVGKRLMEF
jgi:hypothetical protein